MLEQVFAQGLETTVKNPLSNNFNSLSDIFGWVVNLLLGVGYALVFVMLALGFIQYVMSRGEKTAVDQAQKWLTYAVIGGVGLFFITVIKSILENLTGGDINQNGITDFIT
ncbi:hypothetical protein ACFL13_02860 [Patescibacteria group bacterium]